MARRHASTIDLTADASSPNVATARAESVAEFDSWVDRSRVVLTPLAAPSILGLFGSFAASIMVGTNLAGWWSSPLSSRTIFPLALVLGGLAQFLAAMWSYRVRDGLATAFHGTWGSFWMAWGVLQLLYATGTAVATPLGTPDVAMAIWFVPICAITASAAMAALTESVGLFTVMGALAGGSGILAAGLWSGSLTAVHVAGWFMVIGAAAAWYVATAMMLVSSSGRTVLPLGTYRKSANRPMAEAVRPIEYPLGDPGVRFGQ
jgi:succinate-acetate transporter protein